MWFSLCYSNIGGVMMNRLQSNPCERDWWAKVSGVRFSKAKCQVLPLGHKNPTQHYKLGAEWLGSCPVEKNPGVLHNQCYDLTDMVMFAQRCHDLGCPFQVNWSCDSKNPKTIHQGKGRCSKIGRSQISKTLWWFEGKKHFSESNFNGLSAFKENLSN